MPQHLSCDKALQGSGLFYFTDLKASSARGVIPIELAKVEASTDKSDKDRFLIKVWVASAYKDIAKHRRYILSSSSSQVQVWLHLEYACCDAGLCCDFACKG